MLAVSVSGYYALADAYGVLAGAPDGGDHLIIAVKNMNGPGFEVASASSVTEVTFSASDIFGSFPVVGHPGVVGLFLTSSTPGSTVAMDDLTSASPYVVAEATDPDARAMFVRGFTWTPPRRHAYP